MNTLDRPFPIIRLEVEGMRRSIIVALQEANLKLDEDMRVAVEQACEPQRVKEIIYREAREQVDAALKGAVKNWFCYTGDGQKVIRDEVARQMKEWYGLQLKD